MPMLNAAGQPVALKPMSFQIDIPAEPIATVATVNPMAILAAAWQVAMAWMTGNQDAIFAAVIAFFKALTGG